jgi:Zn finger protein HypA/HybF involved in hydrogenase expression
MFEELKMKCPKCKSINLDIKPCVYDDGEISEDTDEAKCKDCGWEFLIV